MDTADSNVNPLATKLPTTCDKCQRSLTWQGIGTPVEPTWERDHDNVCWGTKCPWCENQIIVPDDGPDVHPVGALIAMPPKVWFETKILATDTGKMIRRHGRGTYILCSPHAREASVAGRVVTQRPGDWAYGCAACIGTVVFNQQTVPLPAPATVIRWLEYTTGKATFQFCGAECAHAAIGASPSLTHTRILEVAAGAVCSKCGGTA